MTETVREAPHHNNLTCYTDYRCRLPECVERRRKWQQENRRKRREGRPVLVDAGPVRAHLYRLHAAGVSLYRVALITGLDDYTVRSFMPSSTGRRVRKNATSPEIAAKILAVTPEDAASSHVDGTGTRRRIQALAANGWPVRRLDEHLGLNRTYIADLAAGRQVDRPVLAATAEKVARAYEQLKGRKPVRHGVEARVVKRIRGMAAARNWPPARYWDQFPGAIDDPHFVPEYGKTRLEILAEDGLWAMRGGCLDRDLIAERLGVDRSYLDRALAAHPEPAPAVSS